MSSPKIALVTGASSGFGQLTASSLADRGYRVFGTSRGEHSTPSNDIGMSVILELGFLHGRAALADLPRLDALLTV